MDLGLCLTLPSEYTTDVLQPCKPHEASPAQTLHFSGHDPFQLESRDGGCLMFDGTAFYSDACSASPEHSQHLMPRLPGGGPVPAMRLVAGNFLRAWRAFGVRESSVAFDVCVSFLTEDDMELS